MANLFARQWADDLMAAPFVNLVLISSLIGFAIGALFGRLTRLHLVHIAVIAAFVGFAATGIILGVSMANYLGEIIVADLVPRAIAAAVFAAAAGSLIARWQK